MRRCAHPAGHGVRRRRAILRQTICRSGIGSLQVASTRSGVWRAILPVGIVARNKQVRTDGQRPDETVHRSASGLLPTAANCRWSAARSGASGCVGTSVGRVASRPRSRRCRSFRLPQVYALSPFQCVTSSTRAGAGSAGARSEREIDPAGVARRDRHDEDARDGQTEPAAGPSAIGSLLPRPLAVAVPEARSIGGALPLHEGCGRGRVARPREQRHDNGQQDLADEVPPAALTPFRRVPPGESGCQAGRRSPRLYSRREPFGRFQDGTGPGRGRGADEHETQDRRRSHSQSPL